VQITLAEWNSRLDEDAARYRLEALIRQMEEQTDIERKQAAKAKRKAAAAKREAERKALQEIARQARIEHWLTLVGLPPPEERPFTPRKDGIPSVREVREEFRPIGRLLGCWSMVGIHYDEPSPGWENVVRAYEEDR